MDFQTRLKQTRLDRNMTQEQLGKKVNVTKVSISGYESGNRTPDMETLQKIADVLDISIDYLLGRIDAPSPRGNEEDILDEQVRKMMNDPETSVFFKGYLDAPEEKKKQMRDFMKFILEQEKDRKPGDKQGE